MLYELKHINSDIIYNYPTCILYRMRNCLLYFDSLDFDTQCCIMDELLDRYVQMLGG